LDFRAAVTSSAVKCILLEEPTYLRSRKDLKRAMPHLSVSMSKPFFLEVAQKSTKRQV
jgi:hypothetical protein